MLAYVGVCYRILMFLYPTNCLLLAGALDLLAGAAASVYTQAWIGRLCVCVCVLGGGGVPTLYQWMIEGLDTRSRTHKPPWDANTNRE